MQKYCSVLTIAGSDSGGGAGIQADLKTFAALGCYGTSAITAVTAQNTLGVTVVHPIPAAIVTAQLKAVMEDITPLAVKIGMVNDAAIAKAIAAILEEYKNIPVIFDPVMAASTGKGLLEEQAISILKTTLLPLTTLLTPNLNEAAILTKIQVTSVDEMLTAAKILLQTGCEAVLLKGGHLTGTRLYDIYLHQNGTERVFESALIESNNLHGTGCTLSSAIAGYLALGLTLENAVTEGRSYVYNAILNGTDVKTGNGQGPLNHFFDPQQLQKI